MKKIAFILLAVLLALLLAGCSETEEPEATPEPTVAPTVEPTPEPTANPSAKATPVPVVAVGDYTYSKLNNQSLNVSLKYPSHWINEPGTYTISFKEPVEEGEIASRFAVTTKSYEGTMTKELLKQEAKDYSAMLSLQFDKYDRDNVSSDVEMLGHTAYSYQFTGEKDGVNIRGFACIGFSKKTSKLYALNFYATSTKFPHMDVIRRMILNSIDVAY